MELQKHNFDLPMKAFGIVIFSHNLSLISRPEFGLAIALTIVSISVFTVKCTSSTVSAATIIHTKTRNEVSNLIKNHVNKMIINAYFQFQPY